MKRALLLMAIIFTVGLGAAQAAEVAPDVIFDSANQSYLAGEYEAALRDYLLIAADYRSPELFSNIGASYAALDDPGRAVLWFERALVADPYNEDVAYNLGAVRDKIVRIGAAEVTAENPNIFAGMDDFFRSTPYHPLRNIFIVFYSIFSALLLLSLFRRFRTRAIKIGLIIFGCLVLVSGLFFAGKGYYEVAEVRAVVVDSSVKAMAGPDEKFDELFSVPEGWVVDLVEERPAWVKVRLPNGLSGWLPEKNLERI